MSDAERQYKEAHHLHYVAKELDAAAARYEDLIEAHPNTPEARYARTQLANIAKAKAPPAARFEKVQPLETLDEQIRARFTCGGCGNEDCTVKRLAISGASWSRLLDVQNNLYLAVACTRCGRAQLYDLSIIEGKSGLVGGVLDLIL